MEKQEIERRKNYSSHYLLYTASSLLSSVVDLLCFQILLMVLPGLPLRLALATFLARAISSTFNYFVKKWMVFSTDRSKGKSLFKFYILCVLQVCTSALMVSLADVLPGPAVVKKMVVDTTLFFVSYLIQRFWVFDGVKK